MSINTEKLKSGLLRAMWLSIALLFVLSAVGIGIYYFWQATKQDSQSQTQPKNSLRGKPMPDFTPVVQVESLQKIDQKVGSGAEAKIGSTVTVLYTGAVAATGLVFDSSSDSGQPAQFVLKGGPEGLIQGWADGLPGMKVGGQRRLLIPANLAYGSNPPPTSGIPANADLVFDISLLAVQ
ncbi:MAG TPA: FKBP-type peptidyl-prolyl cis-trans isomerase [Candidatus Saccharimonadales bacterium]|nr:FKBP-type peptidyl-prolyl cis-trans isomerase [Candidatus Saccharimonadales bacterium]